MDVTKIPDTRVSNECCACYMTWFWWPGMATQMQKTISIWEQCIQYKGSCTRAPMWLIIVTTPLELLYVDFTSIETTMELDQPPNAVNLLVLCNHFTKHFMAYVTPNQAAKTVGKNTSWSSEPQPRSWVTEESTLKATSSETFVTLWAYGSLRLHLTMLKQMHR